MPTHLPFPIRRLSQEEFGEISYEVVRQAFAVHEDFGRLFDEAIYQKELAHRLKAAQTEVPVEITFDGFSKTYFLDLLVSDGALFEIKAVEAIAPRHRAQLLNYLLLSETSHGKLLNFRTERIEHEFVNTALSHADRTSFLIEDRDWQDGCLPGLKEWVLSLLRDWGVGLDLSLYLEAILHHLGPQALLGSSIKVHSNDGHPLGNQNVHLLAPDVAIRVSAFDPAHRPDYERHLRRFHSHSSLRVIQWINLTRTALQFQTISS